MYTSRKLKVVDDACLLGAAILVIVLFVDLYIVKIQQVWWWAVATIGGIACIIKALLPLSRDRFWRSVMLFVGFSGIFIAVKKVMNILK